MNPAVSILMPVYNSARYIKPAVQSVLEQTFGDFELIVVDDGSTDATGSILTRLAGKDRRIKLIRRPNTGIVGALNDALAEARGELLGRMDGDDICLPDRLQKQVDWMCRHPQIVALGGQVEIIAPDGGLLMRSDLPLQHESIDRQLLAGIGGSIIHPAAMLRAEPVRRLGGYRREFQYVEDLDLFLRLAEIGQLANLPDTLLKYRQHLGSINRNRFEQQKHLMRLTVADAHHRRGTLMPPDWQAPLTEPQTSAQLLNTWGWWALKCDNVSTARHCAMESVRKSPGTWANWKLLMCALRGR